MKRKEHESGRRDFLKRFGSVAVLGAATAATADEFVAVKSAVRDKPCQVADGLHF